MNRIVTMVRVAAGVLVLCILVSQSGCTWTETYRDYPPDVERMSPADSPNNQDG